jgi:uncharacterized membrane protein YhaH (DUF805 family)
MIPLKLLWSLNGRIGRVAYAGGLLLNWVLMLFVLAVWQILTDNWTPPEPFNLKDGSLLVLIPFALLFCWAHFALTARRLHDLGVTGLWSLLLLVPPALLTTIAMALARHQPGCPRRRITPEPRPRFRRLDVPQCPWR